MECDLFLWIISFVISLALVASVFYQVICLTDLTLLKHQSVSTVWYYLSSSSKAHSAFSSSSLGIGSFSSFLSLYNKRRHLIDVTEVFRGIDFEKKLRFTKLGFYIVLFILIVFRLTLSVVYNLTEDDDLIHLF
ncbi:Protein cornichon-like protein 1 [Raphanus sativus]|nr:Protein cornichon-like protein 1 [Raphanus sativus]KAJ4885789.1 Protein cornichon-like protein 1 [Raphanus sativus]